jgi:endonuclease YncB( thermonuclease family)
VTDPRTLAVDYLNHYGGTVHHVHDADTLYCLTWVPQLQMYGLVGIRVRGVQAPELTDPGGPETRQAVVEKAPVGSAVVLGEMGPYPRPGHVTASITLQDGTDLAYWLVERGYAVRWDGKGKRPTVPWPPADPV